MLIVLITASFAWASGQKEAQGKTEPLVPRFSTQGPPDLPTTAGFFEAAKNIKEKTNGAIDIQVFHSGQLANQKTTLQEILQGSIDMAWAGTTWMATLYKPLSIASAPYLFRSADHMQAVLNGEIGQHLFDEFEKKSGVKVLDVWYYGTRQVTSNKKATKPEEFSKLKLRTPGALPYIEAVQVLGASATPVEFGETYLALKTGTVDGQENPFTTIKTMKFFEVQKYIIITNHYVENGSPLINSKTWNKLSPEYQKIILQEFKASGEKAKKVILDDEQNLGKWFESNGLEIVRPDLSIFEERAMDIYKKHENDWYPALIAKIKAVK